MYIGRRFRSSMLGMAIGETLVVLMKGLING